MTHPLASLKAFYSPRMVADAERLASPSDRKPREVSQVVSRTPWPVDLVAPEPISVADICRVHDSRFVVDVLELRRASGFGSRSASVARSLPYTCGACYCSAVAALAGSGRMMEAVNQLLESIRRDREWNDQAARKQLLTIFEAAGPVSDVAKQGRRKLSSILFA